MCIVLIIDSFEIDKYYYSKYSMRTESNIMRMVVNRMNGILTHFIIMIIISKYNYYILIEFFILILNARLIIPLSHHPPSFTSDEIVKYFTLSFYNWRPNCKLNGILCITILDMNSLNINRSQCSPPSTVYIL